MHRKQPLVSLGLPHGAGFFAYKGDHPTPELS